MSSASSNLQRKREHCLFEIVYNAICFIINHRLFFQNNPKLRRWRTKVALGHIGVSICSSAITTIIAAIPLTQAVIEPFSKFGQIVTINTGVSIVYTMTVVVALLSTVAPAKFVNSVRSGVIALFAMLGFIGVLVLSLYILAKKGISVPAPNGNDLFPQ